MTSSEFPLSVSTAVATTLAVEFLVAAENAGWMRHGPLQPGQDMLVWGATFLIGWILMTAAMTLPSNMPFLRAADRVGGGRAAAIATVGVAAFWVVSGVVFLAVLWVAGGMLLALPPGGIERVAAVTLAATALYLVSPLAHSCQRLCARPYAIFARRWRGGADWYLDAFSSGVTYGATCFGCCAPMMAVMFLVGMSDLRWIFALGVLTILQKHPVWGPRITWPGAFILASAAVAIGMDWWIPELKPLRELCRP